MCARKRHDYAKYLDELEQREGIIYKPLIWSAWGRAHPETDIVLHNLARQVARRRGLRDHHMILRRTRAAVGVQLMRRVARMFLSCVPHLEDAEATLILGHCESVSHFPQTRNVALVGGSADCGIN